jgi:hypothetical protein
MAKQSLTRESLELDEVTKWLDARSAEEEKTKKILRKSRPTSEEMSYVLFNEAFGMRTASSLQDGDREVLSVYLDEISERTLRRHYHTFKSKPRAWYANLSRIRKSANRIFNSH